MPVVDKYPSTPDHPEPAGSINIDSEFRTLRDFAELSSDWFWEQDAEFRFTRFFGLSTQLLRKKQSEFFGKRRWDLPIQGVTDEQLAAHIAACERHLPFRNFEYVVTGDGDALQYYSISGTPIFNQQGNFVGYHGIGRNITERRLADLLIKNSERQLSQILDVISIPTFVIDVEHRVTHWNRACANITRLDADKMRGNADVWRAFYTLPRPIMADLVVAGATDAEVAAHYPEFEHSRLIDGGLEAVHFFPQMGQEGIWLFVTAVPLRDTLGNIIGCVETLQDVSSQRKAQAQLEQLASLDGLTGLANRRSFDATLAKECKRAQRGAMTLSLLMIDVDHFKLFNDTYGHQAGDHCLQQIAQVLAQVVNRPDDLVARYGGEEFAVILTATLQEGAAIVASRVLQGLTELALPHSGCKAGLVTLSIGISTTAPGAPALPVDLIASADRALYQAKHAGRNRIFYDHPF